MIFRDNLKAIERSVANIEHFSEDEIRMIKGVVTNDLRELDMILTEKKERKKMGFQKGTKEWKELQYIYRRYETILKRIRNEIYKRYEKHIKEEE